MGGCCCSSRKPQLHGTPVYYYVSNFFHYPLNALLYWIWLGFDTSSIQSSEIDGLILLKLEVHPLMWQLHVYDRRWTHGRLYWIVAVDGITWLCHPLWRMTSTHYEPFVVLTFLLWWTGNVCFYQIIQQVIFLAVISPVSLLPTTIPYNSVWAEATQELSNWRICIMDNWEI